VNVGLKLKRSFLDERDISNIFYFLSFLVGSHGVSRINSDPNTKMLDRSKYLGTFIYEIFTAIVKIVDPILGLLSHYTKKKIFLQLFFGVKTLLISTQLVGTTYLYTIRINFEQLTETRYEACYYKSTGNDTECLEAWQSLQNTYSQCNASTAPISSAISRQLFEEQKLTLFQLIESIPEYIDNTTRIIESTTNKNSSLTTNVRDWWNPLAQRTLDVHKVYRINTSVVTSSTLNRLIMQLPEEVDIITDIINRTTFMTTQSSLATTQRLTTASMPIGTTSNIINRTTFVTTQPPLATTESLTTVSMPIETTSNIQTTVQTGSSESYFSEGETLSGFATSTTGSESTDHSQFVVSNLTSSPPEFFSSPMITEPTNTGEDSTTSDGFTSAIVFFRINGQAQGRQVVSPISYTPNVTEWWDPFSQLLTDVHGEYRQMVQPRVLPSPPEPCKEDIYHMKYIATDLTVSVVIFSLNMITDVVGFGAIYKLWSEMRKLADFHETTKF
jgi:hypothetical protein